MKRDSTSKTAIKDVLALLHLKLRVRKALEVTMTNYA